MRVLAIAMLLSAGCFSLLHAAPLNVTIDHATVFLSGAELTSKARVTLTKGENELIFTNVAGNINEQSIVVKATNGAAVQSVTFQNNFLNTENVSPKVKELKDSIELMTTQQQTVANKITTLTEQITLLQSNRKVSGDHTGLAVAELIKMLDLIDKRMEALLNEKQKQEKVSTRIGERLTRLQAQLSEEQSKEYQPGGRLLVKFFAPEATASDVEITYVVPNAGWTPIYDISADNASGPVTLYYKANIYQNSGVKWDHVKLTVSTGNPVEGMQSPVLTPWYLSFYVPVLKNAVVYKTNKAMAPAVAEAQGAASTMAWSAQDVSTMNGYTQVDNSGVNTEFDIELPYTIPTDGQQHLVAMKKYTKPATYIYYAAPKLDKDAFIQARITDWEDLNLLPGQTNIFYEGTFLGNGYIDPAAVTDTMSISLGRDKKVVVKREADKKYRSVKMIGSNVREQFGYTITVRNTRKETVTVEVNDQQPITTESGIVIEDRETGGAAYNEETGLMKWTLTLAPNETKKLNFGYTIKYPKGKTVAGK